MGWGLEAVAEAANALGMRRSAGTVGSIADDTQTLSHSHAPLSLRNSTEQFLDDPGAVIFGGSVKFGS